MRRLQAAQNARAGVTPVPASAPASLPVIGPTGVPAPGGAAAAGIAGGQAQRQPPMVPVPAM